MLAVRLPVRPSLDEVLYISHACGYYSELMVYLFPKAPFFGLAKTPKWKQGHVLTRKQAKEYFPLLAFFVEFKLVTDFYLS